jgi:hypothetical protein
MSTHIFAKGCLDALERHDQAHVSGKRFDALVAQMRQLGFSEVEAPFAASARALRGPTTVARMRAHLRATKPFLYTNEEGNLHVG